MSLFDDGISSQREKKFISMFAVGSGWGKIEHIGKICRMRFGTSSWDDISLPPRWHGGLWSTTPMAWSPASSSLKSTCQVTQFQFVSKIVA